MEKKRIVGLVLLGVAALVLILNVGWRDTVSINLLVTTVATAKSIVLLGAVSFGVLIGVLLK
jgi:hypothetical protein